MGVFGPKYPPPVQGVVSHAERFCELLSHAERFGLCDSVAARVFVYGRQSEIELVLELALADMAAGRVPVESAVASIAAYLEELHESASEALGLDGELDCCCDEVMLTEVSDAGEALTRIVRRPAATARSTSETWFDPVVILREVDTERAAGPPQEVRSAGASQVRKAPCGS